MRMTFDLTYYSVSHLNLLVVSRQQLSWSQASQHVVEDVEVSLSPETHHHQLTQDGRGYENQLKQAYDSIKDKQSLVQQSFPKLKHLMVGPGPTYSSNANIANIYF